MNSETVLVVGAGPAGCVAALRLARAGVRVRLLDRATFPRDKLCGDTLNPGSLAMLDRLGLGECVRRGALRTTGMRVTGPGSASVSAAYPDGLYGLAIRRRDLDMALVEAAVAAGVQFEPGVAAVEPLVTDGRVTGVRVITRDASGTEGRHATVSAPILIAADGRGSRLGSALRLARFSASPRRWAYGAYFADVDGLTSRGEMHVRGGGYIGVAPLPGGLANVCVVHTRAGGTPAHAPAEQVMAEAIASSAELRDRFRRAARLSPVAVLGPLAVEASAAGCAGLLLAGDAAGFVDPMTGDGMRFALRGGELAAAAAMRELDGGVPAFEALAAERSREFAGKWRINRALRALVGSPRAVAVAASMTRRWSTPVEYLIGVAGDVSLARG